jgi:hypothetical protein
VTKLKGVYFLVLFMVFCHLSLAQKTVDVHAEKTPIISVLKTLSEKYKISFFYSNELKDLQRKVTLDLKKVPLKTAINSILKGTNLVFKFVNDQILIKSKSEVDLKDTNWIVPKPVFFTLFAVKKELIEEQKWIVSGYLKDSLSGEDLVLSTIESSKARATTNNYGFFSISLPKGLQTILFSSHGYYSDTLQIKVERDTIFTYFLAPTFKTLSAVVVSGSDANTLMADFSAKKDISLSKNLSKGGISTDDIVENVKLQAGVMTKNEGSSGYNVRGGNHDQNLILIDGAPVYNESHFLGLLSVFNSNSIKKATLYKSGIPAEFGSRLSSVLDIQTKDGNKEKLNYNASINPFFVDYAVEGPLQKDKSSFFFSGRNSLLGLLFNSLISDQLAVDNFRFYDFNGKINYKINDKNRVYYSSYLGRDVFTSYRTASNTLNELWGNYTNSLKWNHLFNSKLFSNAQIITSNYQYKNYQSFDQTEYYLSSQINSLIFKYGLSYYHSNSHKISYGIQSQITNYIPGQKGTLINNSTIDSIPTIKLRFNNTLESAIYVQDDIKLGDKISFSVALRTSLFNHMGVGKNFEFNLDNSIDTISKTGMYNLYTGLEPRLKCTVKTSSTANITGSYDRTYQYMSLASNSISRSPTDVWVPATNNVEPQFMNLFTVGYNALIDSSKYILNTSIYYKDIHNVVDFVDNAYLKLNQLIESQLKQGRGTSYGFELMFGKTKGNFTFNLNYHLGKSTFTIREINNGQTYYAPYHKLHSGNLCLNYKINEIFDFQLNTILSSGARSTFPIATYTIQGTQFTYYNERNADQLPAYARIDLAFNMHGKPKKWGMHELIFSIYNVLNRKNPYSISFEKNTTTAYYNYLLPIIPSLTYKINIK